MEQYDAERNQEEVENSGPYLFISTRSTGNDSGNEGGHSVGQELIADFIQVLQILFITVWVGREIHTETAWNGRELLG